MPHTSSPATAVPLGSIRPVSAGAVGIAALLAGRLGKLDGPVAVVLSGRNVDMGLHRRVMNGEEAS